MFITAGLIPSVWKQYHICYSFNEKLLTFWYKRNFVFKFSNTSKDFLNNEISVPTRGSPNS